MRVQTKFCSTLGYELGEPEGPAIEVPEDARGPFAFSDCLYLEVGVEDGDLVGLVVGAAAKRIHRICQKTDAQMVVINAFASLAAGDLRATPEDALRATQALEVRLINRGYRVHLMPFGWTKQLELHVVAGVYEQGGFAVTQTVAAGETARPIRTPDGLLIPAAMADVA